MLFSPRLRLSWLMRYIGVLGMAAVVSASAHAVTTIPATAELQRLQDVIRQSPPAARPPAVLPLMEAIPSPTATMEKEDARFVLESVELRGVTQISPSTLLPIFERLAGQETSVAALEAAVAEVTKLYRAKGYFLSRAYLPPQELVGGHAVIAVTEGWLDDVIVTGSPRSAVNPLVKKILARFEQGPLTSARLENMLLRLNDIPGLIARGTLSPGAEKGATKLTIQLAETQPMVEAGYSNHGSRYLGPTRFEVGGAVHNLASPYGDTLAVQAIQSPNWSDLTYAMAMYSTPLNSYGFGLDVSAFGGISRPKWTLEALDIASRSVGGSIKLTQQMQRQRDFSWDAYTLFDWQDVDSTTQSLQLSADHLRVLRFGANTQTVDSWGGFTNTNAEFSAGLGILGATGRNNFGASRLRGTGRSFNKIGLDISRLQRLNDVWNLYVATIGQFADHALLAGEEFSVGGESFGRGYDAGELTGEHGFATRAELQANFDTNFAWLDGWQLFGFHDFGMVWNRDRDITESNQARTLASVGTGVRLQFTPHISGELMMAKPPTRIKATEGDDNVSLYFRLKSKFNVPMGKVGGAS